MTGANGRRACDAVPCSEIAGRWSGLQAQRGSAGHTLASASSVCPTRSRDHHPTPSVNSLECYFGNLPVTITVVENSALGCSMILVADTFIPFFRSLTDAGLPSTTNWTDGGTM